MIWPSERPRSLPGSARFPAALILAALGLGACRQPPSTYRSFHAVADNGAPVAETRALYSPSREEFLALRRAFSEGDYAPLPDQAEAFLERYPHSCYGPEAAWLAAEARFSRGELLPAYRSYTEYAKEYPGTSRMDILIEREYALARKLLRGAPTPFLGIRLFPRRGKGREFMEKLVDTYPRHPRASDAVIELAKYHQNEREFELSRHWYQQLIKDYPESAWVDLARFSLGETWYQFSEGPYYDPHPRAEALAAFSSYLEISPEGGHSELARARVNELRASLSRYLCATGSFYRRRSRWTGARLYYQLCRQRYPDTEGSRRAGEELADLPPEAPGP